MPIQTIKLSLLFALVLVLAASLAAAPPALADRSSIMKTLFHNAGEGFTPPADNQALQALLAQHPALTFLEACGVGDTAEIVRQLKRDPKLATTWTEFGWSALHLAAFSGVPGAVQLLLDRGADLHARARSKFRNTPLQAALLAGQLATAKLLLERGADPLVRQAKGFTPLHEAAQLGRRDLVDLLLGAGAEINSRSDDGRTPMSEALRGKHAELADYLRSKGGHGAEITADLQAEPRD
ncbi:MAG TPA: ankyrin repeat domain-containing protein [Kofleriaceae bacterium]|jgi:ankyrin repeat protein|nr:ankyrin repeat domain-containing protein [Kofleriaceae bacterium]